jgi:arylformamidase
MPNLQVIDLSRPVNESTYVLTELAGYTDPPIRFETWTSIEEKGYTVTAIHMGAHAGTHCDVSSHYVQGGRTITDFPASDFVGPAAVGDFRGAGPIGPEALDSLREALRSEPEAVVIFRNTPDDPLTPEARRLLVEMRPKLVVAGEGWNLDENYYESDAFHRADIPLILNPDLDALNLVEDGDLIIALPLRLVRLEASPVRLVAVRGLGVTRHGPSPLKEEKATT